VNYKFDFVKHRKRFFAVSIIITVLGLLSMVLLNLNYGVDFKAGTRLDIEVGKPLSKEEALAIIQGLGHSTSLTVGGTDESRVSARFDEVLPADEVTAIISAFKSAYGEQVSYEGNIVDPVIAQELGLRAIYAVLIASIGIIIYVSIRFEWRFAIAAIIALLHDAFIVISIFSIFRLEVNLTFVAAILTIIGYSINDTIVIFDRIRENLRFAKLKTHQDLCNLVNKSIWQTMARSINTGITVLFASLCLLFFGSQSIALFSLAMTLGLICGVYSSIFIASQVWLLLKNRSLNKPIVSVPVKE